MHYVGMVQERHGTNSIIKHFDHLILVERNVVPDKLVQVGFHHLNDYGDLVYLQRLSVESIVQFWNKPVLFTQSQLLLYFVQSFGDQDFAHKLDRVIF